MRLTISLEEKLEKALRDRRSGLEAAGRARQAAKAEAARIEAEAAKSLQAVWAPIRAREQAVNDVMDELGLVPQWQRWRDSAWALEEAEAGVEGSPYGKADGPSGANDSTAPPDDPAVGAHAVGLADSS